MCYCLNVQFQGQRIKKSVCIPATQVQGGSNMTGTDFCVNKPRMYRSYLNHLVRINGNNRGGMSIALVDGDTVHSYPRKHDHTTSESF